MKVLPYGDDGLLAEPEDPSRVLALAAALRGEPGIVEVVPAARTVLAVGRPDALPGLRRRILGLAGELTAGAPAEGPEVTLDVTYDGADLAPVFAVVTDLDRAAQLRPGEEVRFSATR